MGGQWGWADSCGGMVEGVGPLRVSEVDGVEDRMQQRNQGVGGSICPGRHLPGRRLVGGWNNWKTKLSTHRGLAVHDSPQPGELPR